MKPRWFLFLCCIALCVLWYPGLKYPPFSDTVLYGLLGESVWEQGRYWLFGEPFAKHLPLQAVVSYPFTELLGLRIGMRISSLIAGFAVLFATFALARERFGKTAAMLATAGILLHPAFVLMAMQGSADLLFTLLFLLTLLFFLRAHTDKRLYVAVGLAAGMMCLTRYNGIPIAGMLAVWVLVARRADLRSPFLWIGALIGGALIASWFVRNALVFGTPFHSEYTAELAADSLGPIAQLVSNIRYYLNPIHNILPFLFPFALYGLWTHGRSQMFLVCAMLASWVLTAIWWVQAIRFAFAGYAVLTIFAAEGLVAFVQLVGQWRRQWKISVMIACTVGFLGIHVPTFCIYTYGECNAWIDKTFGFFKPDLGLTPEGFYAWYLAREQFNSLAESGALLVTENALTSAGWQRDTFRPDIRVSGTRDTCPYYRIVQEQNIHPAEEVLFKTDVAPRTAVTRFPCM